VTLLDEYERDVHDEESLRAFLGRHGVEHTDAITVVTKDAQGNVTKLAEILPPFPKSASVAIIPV
jgi:hypothetical protein